MHRLLVGGAITLYTLKGAVLIKVPRFLRLDAQRKIEEYVVYQILENVAFHVHTYYTLLGYI